MVVTVSCRNKPLQEDFRLVRFHFSERDSHSDVRLGVCDGAQCDERLLVMSDCHFHFGLHRKRVEGVHMNETVV